MAKIHWLYKDRIFWLWIKVKQRCLNEKDPAYKNYWWRWIGLCKEWMWFQNFYNDMRDSYKEWLTLERIDNNKWYSKENCKWATRKEQARNTRQCPLVEYNWIKRSLAEWSEKIWIKPSTLRQRYYVYKWDLEKCLTYNTKLWAI